MLFLKKNRNQFICNHNDIGKNCDWNATIAELGTGMGLEFPTLMQKHELFGDTRNHWNPMLYTEEYIP